MPAADLPALLHISVNMDDSATVLALLRFDAQHSKLLHSSCGQTGSDSGSDNNQSSGSSDSDSPVQLIEQLLTTAIIRGSRDLVPKLAAVPAAQALGPVQLAKLLYLSLQHEHQECRTRYVEDYAPVRHAPMFVDELCELPAADDIQPASVASLMRFAITCRRFSSSKTLCRLAQAGHIRSQEVCQLIRMAGAAGQRRVVSALAELPPGRLLGPGEAYKLLCTVLDNPWGDGFDMALDDLSAMQLGKQLTGSEVLQLLHVCAAGDDQGSAIREIAAGLKPAADEIDDEAGYVAFLVAAMEQKAEFLREAAEALPITQRLGVEAAAILVKQCVRKRWQFEFVEKIPAIQQFSVGVLEQLLLLGKEREGLPYAYQLLSAQAATQLSSEVVAALLKCAVGDEELHGVMERLLALPAAAEVTVATIADLLAEAAESGDWASVGRLCALPAAAQIPANAVVGLMVEALKSDDEDAVRICCGLPAAAQLSAHDCSEVLATAVQAGSDGPIFSQLCSSLPAAQQLSPDAAAELLTAAIEGGYEEATKWLCTLPCAQSLTQRAASGLYDKALQQGHSRVLRLLRTQLPQLAAVSAVQLTGEQLQQQLLNAVAEVDLEAMHELLRHPAMCQISADSIQKMLQVVLGSIVDDHLACDTPGDLEPFVQPGNFPYDLCQTQMAQGLGVPAVAALLDFALKNELALGIRLLATLPAAGRLDHLLLERLLQYTLEWSCPGSNGKHRYDILSFECLLQLQAVQALPAEAVVRLLAAAMQQGVHKQVVHLLQTRLPGVLQLPGESIKKLLLAAMESQVGANILVLTCYDTVGRSGVLCGDDRCCL